MSSLRNMVALSVSIPAALAASGPSADTRFPPESADQRMINHIRYDDATRPVVSLYDPALGLNSKSVGRVPCQLLPEARGAARELLAAANGTDWEDGWQLRALSCFRNWTDQERIFFGQVARGSGRDGVIKRALKSAPPGYSEHETGYTLDFVVRAAPGKHPPLIDCGREQEPCEKQMRTKVGDWLRENAWKYGFEMSFPRQKQALDASGNVLKDKDGNELWLSNEGVSFEPWHWRWVGKAIDVAGAKDARARFVRARKCFHADPAIPIDDSETEAMAAITCAPQ